MSDLQRFLLVKETALSVNQRILVLYLLGHKVCFLSLPQMAKELGLTIGAIKSALDHLCDVRVVSKHHYEGGLGTGYHVNKPQHWRLHSGSYPLMLKAR